MSNESKPSTPSSDAAFWNGPGGERWVRNQERQDRLIAGFGDAALARAALKPGERVLDVGCGCGATLLEISRAVGPSGAVIGADVSKPMLARARERTSALGNVTIVEGDAATLTLDRPCDVLFSRFGVMFFREPAVAFANLRRALVPGGRVSFVCWRALDMNPWARVPAQALAREFGPTEPSPPDAPGPFAFADRARVESVLASAGFADVQLESCDMIPMFSGGTLDEVVNDASQMGPAARRLAEVDDAMRARGRDAIREALRPFERDGRVTVPAAVWLVTARNPS